VTEYFPENENPSSQLYSENRVSEEKEREVVQFSATLLNQHVDDKESCFIVGPFATVFAKSPVKIIIK
jgi:hypothetical protein